MRLNCFTGMFPRRRRISDLFALLPATALQTSRGEKGNCPNFFRLFFTRGRHGRN